MGMWQIGVDTGGTFTDVVAIDHEGRRKAGKVPSTPPHFEEGIIEGISKLGLAPDEVSVIFHGSTVTTNAALTKSGALTALITTKGFRDVLEIRRAHREDLYDILWDPPAPLVPRFNRLEADERTNYAGEVLKGVDDAEIRELAQVLKKRGVEAVAICFLHSYANPSNELRAKQIIQEELPSVFVSASAEILPQPPEFERTSTVVANAYLGPVLANYVRKLDKGLKNVGFSCDVLLMHSAGGVMTLESSALLPVRTAGSGPAAGVMGAAAIGTAAGRSNLISMDMGGTSCDVSVIVEGTPHLSRQHQLEWGLPIMFPSIDFAAIGAGGGSIAWIDAAGYPKSGPESAGARPGPACYGEGGIEPTTTDANLYLGRLSEENFLGGDLSVDRSLSEAAIRGRLADPLGLSLEEAAAGVVRIANANMASAVRLVTIQKGFDPREFSLVAFGGAGPLHAVEVAKELGIPEVIIPPQPGLTSALGLLFVDLMHDLCQSLVLNADESRFSEAEKIFAGFEDELSKRLQNEGADPSDIQLTRLVDMRYAGQLHTITVPIGPAPFDASVVPVATKSFHKAHEREYRYSRAEWPVEISVLRVEARAATPKPLLKLNVSASPQEKVEREVYFEDEGWVSTSIIKREGLGVGDVVVGPAIVEEFDSTTLIPSGFVAEVDLMSNLLISAERADA
ncbi:MAG: hydantoinase/oxoprolinase family protein [Actinobacteria bacterium]|nr:hydantoinase/oxoprolinase family protein [Actinomycetota bacterium]